MNYVSDDERVRASEVNYGLKLYLRERVAAHAHPSGGEFKVGSIIMSRDFAGREGCYLVGLVTANDARYVYFDVLARVWEGNADPEGADDHGRAPHDGLAFADKCGKRLCLLVENP